MPLHRASAALALLFVVLGCGTSSAATKPLPALRATLKQDGGKLTLHRGQELRVVLQSTYWEFKAVSAPSVLHLVGKPVVRPKSGCVPGAGCGTVTVTYVAKALGSAVVSASRTSCGEAMGCTGDAGSYTLTVSVRS